ncbi:MAG: DNA mismatch repair endonuclease MutL [Candidatus Sulfobium sp.]|jgi:DNA mismatch repair protein MutL
MATIKVLPEGLRSRISAGEVVERPASVVKELIENSIDSGAADIRVEVSHGGKRVIRVSDDGCGMDRDDALLCFERHATSKLLDEEGLFDIRTLGFRGEALPSIASVSRVRLVTGIKGSSAGVSLEVEGGEVKDIRESSFAGTSITVSDIFFNTPARKKFLKTDSTELFHIMDSFTKEAISNCGISFSLFTDGREAMLFPKASGPRERIMQVFGPEFLDGLIGVRAGQGHMVLNALISKGTNFRKNRSHQFVFVNSRPVKDQTVSAALYKAYEGILPGGSHPVFFLFLELDPGKVDFNVHPAKREVRFEEKELIYRFIYSHARDAVKGERNEYTGKFTEITSASVPAPRSCPSSAPSPGNVLVSENASLSYRPVVPFIYLGDTFVAVSGTGGLTVIDHHAAHERILYEKFLQQVDLDSCQLLFPVQIKLSHKEYRLILENKDILSDFGIEVDDFGHDVLTVRALPSALNGADLRGILSDAAEGAREGVRPGKSLKESLAARIACHGSVRGREILNQEELSRLLDDLEKTEHPDQCPHGRPTRIFFSLDDLGKLFKRK